MSSLTNPTAQWTADRSAAVPIQGVTLYQNASGRWVATTNPADAVGYTTGRLTNVSGKPVIDTVASAGLKAVLTPTSLLAY